MIKLQEKKIFKISLIFKLRKCLKNSLNLKEMIEF